jgi:hypothetical protein
MSSGIDWSSFGAVLSQTKRKQMCVVGGKHFCFENNFKTLCVGGVLFIMGNPMYKYQKKLLHPFRIPPCLPYSSARSDI